MNGRFNIPAPVNEPVSNFYPRSEERMKLKAKLSDLSAQEEEIPLFIGGEQVRTGVLADCRMPHQHRHLLGRYHRGGRAEAERAIAAALAAKKDWAAMPFEARAAIFLKAAEMLSGPWRNTLNAATMLGQSKNAMQAEIDSACELTDFLRFNCHFAQEIYSQQPLSSKGVWNYVEQRPLEGFVLAVTPFNFTSIAGNLPTAPAIMGNTVVWKPASSAVYSAYYVMKLLRAAGLPDGVINMVPGSGEDIAGPCIASDQLAGIHFTGSTAVFKSMWSAVGANINRYRSYPRLVGETGGKDFIFVHPSADIKAVAVAMIRGAFEYQGQKCSAAGRAYVPQSMWPALKNMLIEELRTVKMGGVDDFRNFINAVIDANAYKTIKGYIDFAAASSDAEIIAGGKCDDTEGYFIEPTVIETGNPQFKTMTEEIFGPVLTVFVYPDGELDKALDLCDSSSPYGLTGAVFAQDRQAIVYMDRKLVNASGNFYINDKPTGAVVGQQPFGGARASGTNDKAGSMLNLLRWVSPRAVKETFVPAADYRYPFLFTE